MEEATNLLSFEDQLLEDSDSDVEFVRALLSSKQFGPAPKVWKELNFFSEVENAVELRALAKGLTIREILDFYIIGYFSDLSDTDQHFLCTMFLKGKSIGSYDAVNSLFKQMDGMQGVKASLEYLIRHGAGWQGGPSLADGPPKSIKIVIEE